MLLEADIPPPRVRVFVGDDFRVIVQTLAIVLNLAGYEACAVYGGETALRFLELLRPELVVVDVTTPGLAGVTATAASLSLLARCKVLLFSGSSDLHSLLRDQGLPKPSIELLTRPILAEDLLLKLEKDLCSEQPPLLIPIDTGDGTYH